MNIDIKSISLRPTSYSKLEEKAKKFALDVKLEHKLPNTFTVDNIELKLKEEFHITILGNTTGKEFYNLIKEKSEEKINSIYLDIETFLRENMNSVSLTQDYFFLKRKYDEEENARYSIIVNTLSNIISNLYSFLEKNHNISFLSKAPQEHITLFTKGGLGIGLDYENSFEKYLVKKLK